MIKPLCHQLVYEILEPYDNADAVHGCPSCAGWLACMQPFVAFPHLARLPGMLHGNKTKAQQCTMSAKKFRNCIFTAIACLIWSRQLQECSTQFGMAGSWSAAGRGMRPPRQRNCSVPGYTPWYLHMATSGIPWFYPACHRNQQNIRKLVAASPASKQGLLTTPGHIPRQPNTTSKSDKPRLLTSILEGGQQAHILVIHIL
jgi:hypothetical protein